MQLTRVLIKNFRAFADVDVDVGDITVLIGENNSGKTSFLEAVRLCLTQAISRRTDAFDDYDYHLRADNAQVGDAGETSITLWFKESADGEWTDEIMQALDGVITYDQGLGMVGFRIKSERDPNTGAFATSLEFLDAAGNPMRPRRSAAQILRELQQIKPLFYLNASRDAAREFQPRSTFWGPFLRNPTVPEALRQQLETDLSALNARIIAAEPRLQDVKTRLSKAQGIVAMSAAAAVDIEALPERARDLLGRAQVSVTGRTGAKMPLTRHGAGTQSLSVLFLFEAFLHSMLDRSGGAATSPVLALEEPEAHLHPAAIRASWTALKDMPGQKIIATHSGDLLSRVPLKSIRRFCHTADGIKVHRLKDGTLTPDDERKISLHVRSARGELLFARCWLLVEGATEISLLEGVADVLRLDLEKSGVRIVPYRNLDVLPLVKLANDLGITWHCLADGDREGQTCIQKLQPFLNGRQPVDCATMLAEPNIEIHLCENRLGAVYLGAVSPQKAVQITKRPDEAGYWEQVVGAIPDRIKGGKEGLALKVVEEMLASGDASVPPLLRRVLETAVRLSGG